MQQRYPKSHLHWSKSWRRPFESKASLAAKCAWLNRLNTSKLAEIERDLRFKSSYAYSVINRDVPQDWIPPINQLLQECQQSLRVCPSCLQAGFQSDIPQILGLKNCPIHNLPFAANCQHCTAPIKQFGRADFAYSAIYVCWYCGRSLCDTTGSIISDWPILSNERIRHGFAPYLGNVHAAAKACEGFWHLHPRDAPTIYYYLTGHIPTGLPQHFETRHISKIMKHVSVAAYSLPMEEEKLNQMLGSIMRYEERSLQCHLESWSGTCALQKARPRVCDTAFFKPYLYDVRYLQGGDLLENAISVRDDLLKDAYKPSQQYPSMFAFSLPAQHEVQRGRIHRQLLLLVIAHALFHIVRQLDLLEEFCRQTLEYQNRELDTKRHFTQLEQTYAGFLGFWCKQPDGLSFLTRIERWLPSFQMTLSENQPMLRVFRTNLGRLRTRDKASQAS